MTRMFICRHPEKAMLRHGNQQNPPWFEGATRLPEHGLVFLDVLDDIEQSDRVEFLDEWNAPRVHLHQPDRVDARAGKLQSLEVNLASPDRDGRMLARNRREHRACTAADFEEAAASVGIALERPKDQASAPPEPEVILLERIERFELTRREANRRKALRSSQHGDPIPHERVPSASSARPVRSLQSVAAGYAQPHATPPVTQARTRSITSD